MTTITELSPIIQQVLTETADRIAKETGFIQRQRQVRGAGFAQSLVLGWLHSPAATRSHLHHAAIMSGMTISPQGFDKRFTEKAVEFMRRLLGEALQQVCTSTQAKPVLPQFNGVYVSDCSQAQAGGKREKLAVRWELQQGSLQIYLETAQTHDQRTAIMQAPLPQGAVHIGDLGFFNLKRFKSWNEQAVYWLSRFKVGTSVYDEDQQPLDIVHYLQQASQETVCLPVWVGKRERVSAFLVAQRVSGAVYQKRLAQFKQLRRRQHAVSETKVTLAYWTIYLTNIPDLSFAQAHTLARTRWQIELLFKLWKHHQHLTRSPSRDPFRQQCEFYAKLLAVLISHWTLLVTGWQYLALSQVQALVVIRSYALELLRALPRASHLTALLMDIQHDLRHTARCSPRKKRPLTFQLWLDFHALLA